MAASRLPLGMRMAGTSSQGWQPGSPVWLQLLDGGGQSKTCLGVVVEPGLGLSWALAELAVRASACERGFVKTHGLVPSTLLLRLSPEGA